MLEAKIYCVDLEHPRSDDYRKAFFNYNDAVELRETFLKNGWKAWIEPWDLNEKDFKSTLWCGDDRVR